MLANLVSIGENHSPHPQGLPSPMKDRVYKFAEFEFTVADGELRTGNSSVRLQEKPLLLLSALLDHPQTLVTREQLRERMWDSDTFVDYEQGINVAIKKVRTALGDSAEEPKYVQTVAKKGYRFLVPVEVGFPEINASVASPPCPVPALPETPEAVTDRRRFRRRFLLLAVVAAGILCASLWLFGNWTQHRKRVPIHSLAVLPLRDLSPDSGQEYFADGITEEVITNLAQSLPLRVVSRTSVMRYKQTSEPITQIARELGVEAIVEGAVARSGDRVTVTVQLIDATEDCHLWAQKYDRKLKDLLAMEAELSQEIASQVSGTLSSQREIKGVKYQVDPQVHELCLMGGYYWNKRTGADLAKSVEYYQRAITRDPNYAPAFAGLANAYGLMPSYNSVDVQDSYSKAATAARHALELDDSLAEAHATLAFIGLNWMPARSQSEHEFRLALDLNPNSATVHHWYAFYLLFADRGDEAIAEMDVARQLDPLSVIINADEGELLYIARRNDEARVRLRRAIELAPEFSQPLQTLAILDLESGHVLDAIKEAHAALALDPDDPRTIGEAGYVLAAAGQTAEARKLLVPLNDMVGRGAAYPVYVALIYMGLGQRNEALAALEKIGDAKIGGGLKGLVAWHVFDELRTDSRRHY